MKRLLVFLFLFIVFVVFFVLPRVAVAAPFLVCDPHPVATKFELKIDGVIVVPETTGAVGSLAIRYDLADLPGGAHTFEARAGNSWNWSDWTPPLDETKVTCGPVSGFGISEE